MAYKVINRVYNDGTSTINGPIKCPDSLQDAWFDHGTHDEYINVFPTEQDAIDFIENELTE